MNSQDKNENEPVSGGKELRFEPDDVGITILKEDVDAGDEENENLLDSKGQSNDKDEDLDFQIDANSSDQRQPNHSSTAADNFQDLGAFSSQSSNQQNDGQGMGSPLSQEARRKGNFASIPGSKKKSTTPIGINKNQDINFEISNQASNPQRSVS